MTHLLRRGDKISKKLSPLRHKFHPPLPPDRHPWAYNTTSVIYLADTSFY